MSDDKHFSHFFRIGSIQDNKLMPALKHNKREIEAELDGKHGIDPTKVSQNYCLYGDMDAYQLMLEWTSITGNAGVVQRKNAVVLIECIFSLPSQAGVDHKKYFKDCLQWVQQHIGGVLLSFDVHMDEAHPHAHALIIPLMNGKLQGDNIKGGIGNIRKLSKSLFETVAFEKHGVNRPKLTSKSKLAVATAVIYELTHKHVHKDRTSHPLWEIERDNIKANPYRYAEILGIDTTKLIPLATKKKVKSFPDICRSKGKGSFQK